MKKYLIAAVAASLFAASTAKADMFELQINQAATAINAQRGFKSVLDIFDAYQKGELNQYYAGFDKTRAANGTLNFRGIEIQLNYGGDVGAGGDGQLTLNIPSIGVVGKTFNGTNLDTAFDDFKDYLKKNKDDLLKKILKESVSATPYDAVAGNPGSLMGKMTDAAFDNPTINATAKAHGSEQSGGFVILSPSASHHTISFQGQNKKISTMSLPLAYTFKFDNDWALGLDMPLSYVDTDGSVTYAAQIGATLQIPVADWWHILPSFRVGATASEEMLAGGILYSGMVTSKIMLDFGDFDIDILNMGGIIRDYALDVKGYDIAYNMRNNVFKNGAVLKYMIGEKYQTDVFFYDTRYTGTKLYVDAYDEVGFTVTKFFSKDSFFTGIDFTASYTFGHNYKGYRAGFGILW